MAADPYSAGLLAVQSGSPLLLVERTVYSADAPQRRWRLVVAGDLQEATAASDRFARVLALSLLGLGLLLALAALAQVSVGLAPLRALQRALTALDVGSWFAGLRRTQSTSRANAPVLQQREARWKINPIVDWTDRDVWQYMKQHDLPYHPLWEQGYVSIGDFHTTRRWEPGMREEDTRFNGLKRECGIHIDV